MREAIAWIVLGLFVLAVIVAYIRALVSYVKGEMSIAERHDFIGAHLLLLAFSVIALVFWAITVVIPPK